MQQLVGLRGNKYTHTNKTFQITPTQKKKRKQKENKTEQTWLHEKRKTFGLFMILR